MNTFPAPSSPHGRILIIDDQASNIQTVGTLLNSTGYDVMSATSADQALQRLLARKPDLILLDMMMPGVNGLDFCRRLQGKPQWEDIPVIFLSAAGEGDLITAALEAGAVDYVTKPFHRAELLSRVRTHLSLKATRDQFRRVAEDKEELLGLIAHDFKNHLVAMQLHAAYLTRHASGLQPNAARCVVSISREARRMEEGVKELLANEAAAHQSLQPEDVDVAGLAQTTATALRPLAEAKDQTMLVTLPAGPLMLHTDRKALALVLENLLSNAIKFSPPGGSIHFNVSPAGGQVHFQIRDNGPGFSETDKAAAFGRYRRLSARPTGGETSTGLGLSIVKKLTGQLGGTIALESPGEGALCILHLPPLPPV